MPKTRTVIDNAVAEYTRRQTRQTVKRLLHRAERLNGDRLAKVQNAGRELRQVLDSLHAIDASSARRFALTIGWGDRFPA